jgi:hypothetical protein
LNEEAYYVLELSFYVGGIFVHVFIDKPLKDYYVMLFHHIVTVCLILFSYLLGHHRIGVLVLLCHDVSDVFLDYAKCLHYLDFVSEWLSSGYVSVLTNPLLLGHLVYCDVYQLARFMGVLPLLPLPLCRHQVGHV